MKSTPQFDREVLIHRWVADGVVEFRLEGNDLQFTAYRVVGTKEWWRDAPGDDFPSIKLIATLALGVMALHPEVKPLTPQWQHAWKV